MDNILLSTILVVSIGLFIVIALIPYITNVYLGFQIWRLGRKIKRQTDNEQLKKLADDLKDADKDIMKSEKI